MWKVFFSHIPSEDFRIRYNKPMHPTLHQLTTALQKSWSKDTSIWADKLPSDNPAHGQCVVSALVVQDYLGVNLLRVHAVGDGINENHYYNILDDGTTVDTTGFQYKVAVSLSPSPVDLSKGGYSTMRERLQDDEDTLRRYKLLRQHVDNII